MITKSLVATEFKRMRDSMPGCIVKVRFDGGVYRGIRGSLETQLEVANMGPIQNATGAVRLLFDELRAPRPKSGDLIEVFDKSIDEWIPRTVLTAREDATQATLRIDYGHQYA